MCTNGFLCAMCSRNVSKSIISKFRLSFATLIVLSRNGCIQVILFYFPFHFQLLYNITDKSKPFCTMYNITISRCSLKGTQSNGQLMNVCQNYPKNAQSTVPTKLTQTVWAHFSCAHIIIEKSTENGNMS